MKHVLSKLILLTITLTFATFMVSQAAVKKDGDKGQHRVNKASMTVTKANGYAKLDESHRWPDGPEPIGPKLPVGMVTAAGGAASPGVIVGYTFYDYQHNGSMGRMIDVGPHSGNTGDPVVHFSWMYLPDSAYRSRTYAYAAYRAEDHSLLSPVLLHDPEQQYSGYVNIDVTADNRAVVGGHCDLLTGSQHYMAQMHFDGGPAYATFPNYVRVPDSLGAYDQAGNQEAMWPKFMLQFGTDTVLHVITKNWDYYGAHMYFRAVGYEGASEWDYPPYVVDTSNTISHDLTGTRVGNRVALIWAAGPPYQERDCDTCSGLNPFYDGYLVGHMDNDVYYQISEDQGASFEPRVNLTKVEFGTAGYRTYCDLSALFDLSDNLHVIWCSFPFPADLCWDDGGFCFTEDIYPDRSRLFHWSENVPYVRTIADHTYLPSDSCGPPWFWNGTIGKMAVSECQGRLYAMWGQFNDVPNGIIDDCSQWSYDNQWEGGANAEIWIAVSEDGGMTWDRQRNLTNTYTPECDPHFGEDCQSDYWPSMARWGRQELPGEDWTGAVEVDPSGGEYTGDYYLDIQYVNDLDAGGIGFGDEGTWTLNPIKWFRVPCVEPIPAPVMIFGWQQLGDPNYVKPGEYQDTTLLMENIGNTELNYSVSVIEDNGTPGWLQISNFSGYIPSGLYGTETGTVTLNASVLSTGNYFGRLHFTGNDPYNLPRDLEIELIVVDTIISTEWDYLTSTLPGGTDALNGVSLTISNNGNMGHDGRGMYNLDYYPDDCDTTAKVYMYDGSPLIGWLDGEDTVFNYAIWSQSFFSEFGFRSQGYQFGTALCGLLGAEVYQSGTFTTQDSTIAIQKVYLAPQEQGAFMIEYMRVWSYDGASHDGLIIGEGIDWDIPTDYSAVDTNQVNDVANTGGVDLSRNLIYCQGHEAYGEGSDTLYPFNCQYNDDRFGGSAFVESYLNGNRRATEPYGGFVGENDSLQATRGFIHGLLWQEMVQPNLRGTDSLEDIHTVMTYENSFNLGATDTLEFVSILATVHEGTLADLQAAIDAGRVWYFAHDSIDVFEDANGDGQMDLCYICCRNANFGHFYNHEGEFNILDIDNFIEWLLRSPGVPPIYDCAEQVDVSSPTPGLPDGSVDILDVDYMIGYLLRGTHETLGECP
ncbi:MAG: hypothetical protein JSV52_07830 [Candidatus Zixiibacteriota bacterium]|nr:MAG: hypothetical protein JSV52_07830 [candidate division Zixibacteria bacterium]